MIGEKIQVKIIVFLKVPLGNFSSFISTGIKIKRKSSNFNLVPPHSKFLLLWQAVIILVSISCFLFSLDAPVLYVSSKDNENDMISGLLVRIFFPITAVSTEMGNVNFDLKIWFTNLFFTKSHLWFPLIFLSEG